MADGKLSLDIQSSVIPQNEFEVLFILLQHKSSPINSLGLQCEFNSSNAVKFCSILVENDTLERLYVYANVFDFEERKLVQEAVNKCNNRRQQYKLKLLQYFPCTVCC